MKGLKAYTVTDNGEGHGVVVFASNGATARRLGAQELDTEWEGIESCRRAPEFDAHAPGPVPQTVLLAHGWWSTCSHCERRVDNDMYVEVEEDGLNPDDFMPVDTADKKGVYCSQACAAENFAHSRLRQAAQANLIELVEAKFPGAQIKRLHVCGTRLEPSIQGQGTKCSAQFTFPGAKHGATFIFGDPNVYVSDIDWPIFQALYGGRTTQEPSRA